MTSSLTLTGSAERAFGRLAADFQRVFDGRFVSLVACDQHASVAFVASIAPEDLDALAPLTSAWHHDALTTPLVVTPDEFRRSLDAFPQEYQAMLDRHAVIAGTPPFDGVSVDREDLRRACEIQARAHLIHLRQGWLQAAGHQSHLLDVVVRSAEPFRALLSNAAALHGAPHAGDADLTTFAASVLELPGDVVAAILDLDAHPEHARSTLPLLNRYLASAEQLWNFVDRWRRA